MNHKNKIAVVIPVYNAEKYLKKCINSIINQTFNDWILVLVDDGSTDKSGKICNGYAEKYDNIFVIHQENKGCVEARKAGIMFEESQNSEYILITDSDDILPSYAAEKLFFLAKKYNADLVCGQMVRMWKSYKIKTHPLPCFSIKNEKNYDNNEIINDI